MPNLKRWAPKRASISFVLIFFIASLEIGLNINAQATDNDSPDYSMYQGSVNGLGGAGRGGRRPNNKNIRSTKCVRLNAQLFKKQNNYMAIQYFDARGRRINSQYMNKGTTANIKCGGALDTQMVSPDQMTCRCDSGLCRWSYFDEATNNWQTYNQRPPKCVFSSCPSMSYNLRGSFLCDRIVKTGNKKNSKFSRYPSGTRCDLQCDSEYASSPAADWGTCECKFTNYTIQGRSTSITSRSVCEFKNYKYEDKTNKLGFVRTEESFECKDAACSKPADIIFGKTVCDSNMGEGSKCRYECNENYLLNNARAEATCECEGGDQKRTCRFKTPFQPQCLFDYSKMPACDQMPLVPNFGHVSCTNKTTTFDGLERSTHGTTCALKCNPGYEASHHSKAVCTCTGSSSDSCYWKMQVEPTICHPVDVCQPEDGTNPCQNDDLDSNLDLSHKCINMGSGKYTCLCQEGYLFDRLTKKCRRAECPEIYTRMKHMPDYEKTFMPDPECIYEDDFLYSKSDPDTIVGSDKRNRRWIAEKGKYRYYLGTRCYPKCAPGYQIKGKLQYKCICKHGDPNLCDWSDLTAIRVNQTARTRCESKVAHVIEKEMSEMRYLYNQGNRNFGGEELYKPLKAIKPVYSNEIYRPVSGYYAKGIENPVTRPPKPAKYNDNKNGKKNDAFSADVLSSMEGQSNNFNDANDPFRELEDPNNTESESQQKELQAERDNWLENWNDDWEAQWAAFENEFNLGFKKK